MEEYAANLKSIREAAERIRGQVHLTPVLSSSTFDLRAQAHLFFKCENLQRIGAFKMRGALNAIMCLPDELARKGVVTHSSGNFAQAVALAAKTCGIPAHIVMPSNSPQVKRQAVEGYGARVIPCVPTLEARESTAQAVQDETGATFLHPYDQDEVIAGQGTVALELVEQVSNLDAVIVPVGGGGLISGIALALRELAPNIKIYGAEPLGADDAARSKAAGTFIPQTNPNTIADGLKTSLGTRTWPVIRDLLEDIIVVDDAEITDSMRLVWERMKLVIEASAACAVAAAFSEDFRSSREGKRIAIVLSGGNVDLNHLPWTKTL